MGGLQGDDFGGAAGILPDAGGGGGGGGCPEGAATMSGSGPILPPVLLP